jgi:hypothetical protein
MCQRVPVRLDSAFLVGTPCDPVWPGVERGITLPMGNVAHGLRESWPAMKIITLPPEGLLTVNELADRLRVSRNYVYRHARGDEGYDKWPSIMVPYNGRTRFLFAPEHVAIILASMQTGEVITMTRPRPAPVRRAPARKRQRRSS